MRTAPTGGTRGQNRSVFDKNRLSVDPQQKQSQFFFRFFFASDLFLSVGARNFSKCPDPPKNTQGALLLAAALVRTNFSGLELSVGDGA